MSERPTHSREGIAKTAHDLRRHLLQRDKRMTQEQAERRVREAIQRSPVERD